jgi:multiple antibiotic resistance protein
MQEAQPVNELINSFLLVYAALFPIVNPVGSAPIFLGLTRHCTEKERASLAWRVAVNGFFLLLASLLVGSHVLEFFGITLPVLRIAGGLVVTSFGWTMLQAGKDVDSTDNMAKQTRPTDAFYPLTMPLTIGPGSISVAIALGSQRPKGSAHLADLAAIGGAAVAGLFAILATVYFCYRFAERIVAVLGERGSDVMVRLSAFILLCIGIQILWNGISALPGIFGH